MDNRTEAITVEASEVQVVTRIGFAERWLRRARTQCADGDVAAGLLTLSLADAEVRRAMEVGGWSNALGLRPASRTARRAGLPWLVLAAAAAIAVAWAFRPAAGPAGVATAPARADGPSVVHLGANVGTLLSLVTAPSAQPVPGPVTVQAVRVPNRRASAQSPRLRPAVVRPQQVSPLPAAAPRKTVPVSRAPVVTARPPAAAPVAHASPTTPAAVSEVDLIDMILAASRALMGTGP